MMHKICIDFANKIVMRTHLSQAGLFAVLAITGVMTLNLTSNGIIPVTEKGLLLFCLMGEFTNSSIFWWHPQNVKLSTCFPTYNFCSNDNISYNFTADSKGAYAYINSLSRARDNGSWSCEAEIMKANIEIIVYTVPQGLSITQNPVQDVDLSVNSVVLQCKTIGCTYPVPTIKWIFKDQATSSETEYATVSPTGTPETCTSSEMVYTSTLQLPQYTTFNDNSDKTGTFFCRIEYPDTSKIISSLSKNIRFAVNLTSVTLKYSNQSDLPNLTFVNGTPVTLFCVTSTSWPASTVSWFIDAMQITSGINNSPSSFNGLVYVNSSLSLTPSNTDHHNKRIYCQAYTINKTYFQQSVMSLMFIKVQVEGITLYNVSSAVDSSNLSVVDGVSITVNCQTTLSRPASIIIWYKVDNVVSDGVTTTNLTSDGLDFVRSYLTLTPSNSDHGLYIYCQAYNLDPMVKVTSIRATIQVTVYPKLVTMSPSGSPLILLEGQEKRIKCVTSPTRPRPQVRWWLGTHQVLDKITQSESSSGNLIITTSEISLILNRSHTGKLLYCDTTVSGQQTWISSTKSDVTVKYAPDVIVNVSGSTVVGSTAVLICKVQGEPPQYTFHPWIHRVGQTEEIRKLNGVNTDSISILTLSNISIQDMGSYICTVDNSITGLDGQLYQTSNTSLYVQGRPVINEIKTPFTGEPLKPISIQIPFYSHTSIQKLTFIKQIGSQEIHNTSDIYSYIHPSNITMMFYNKTVIISGYVAVLQFRNLTESDFSNYTLTLTNVQGSETMQFEFIASVPPSSPKNFFFVHIDDDFMVFGLEKGFNGGHQQTFIVEYRPSGMSEAAWSNVYRINEDDLPNPSSNGTYYIKIPKIQNGLYDFRVYAQNEKGNSSAIEGVYAEIKTESAPGPSGLQIGAAAGGVVGGISIAIVIIVVIFVMKRRKLNPKMKEYEREEESSDQKHQDSELKLNPVYDSSNPEPLVPVYAAVTKPKKPIAQNEDSNVYAQVDKSKGNKSKMAPKEKPVKALKAQKEKPVKSSKAAQKGKPVKSSRGDIYENSPLPLKNPEEFVYENPGLVATDPNESVYENPGPSASKGHLAEKDGLQYAVLKLGPPSTKGGKPVIHGLENRTEYAEIAFGKRGKPLPDSDEEKKDGAN